MKVKIVEKEVMDPIAETMINKIKMSHLPKKITKITYFDNTKPNADIVLNFVKKSLNIKPIEVTKPAGAPATDYQINEAKKGDIIILAIGDCGSCTTWLVLDAIKLEKEGKPTLCICTIEFKDYAESLAKAQGADNLRIIEMEHPVAGLEKEELKIKTQKILSPIKRSLGLK